MDPKQVVEDHHNDITIKDGIVTPVSPEELAAQQATLPGDSLVPTDNPTEDTVTTTDDPIISTDTDDNQSLTELSGETPEAEETPVETQDSDGEEDLPGVDISELVGEVEDEDAVTAPIADDQIEDDTAFQPTVPTEDAVSSEPAETTSSSMLDEVKTKALLEIAPMLDELDIAPADKFEILMTQIQQNDDATLIEKAYEQAHAIEEDKFRGEALAKLVHEINYLKSLSA